MPDKSLLVIDGHSLVHRAFHAFPKHFTSPVTGEPTGAVYGFARLLLLAIKRLAPAEVIVAFDPHGPTFRDKLFDTYKGKRPEIDPQLLAQIPRVKELVSAFGIPAIEVNGFEADDAIATLTSKSTRPVLILSGDRDLLQLVSDRVSVLMPQNGKGFLEYTPELVKEKFGVSPEQFIDYKALRGDASDNIPGVAGIGEKTAVVLLASGKSLEELLDHPPEKYQALLTRERTMALLSKRLVTLRHDVPIPSFIPWPDGYRRATAIKFLELLGSKTLLADLPADPGQPTLL